MYNDESSQGQGQGGVFVRRPIPKYNGDASGGEYKQPEPAPPPARSYPSSGGGYRGGYSRDRQGDGSQSSYSGSARRGERSDGGGSGGYRGGSGGYSGGGGGGGGYRSGGGSYGGYNRGGGSSYGSNDRLVRQNDVIIQLLKEIRDRLPAPPGGVPTSGGASDSSYGSERSYSSSRHSSYSSAGASSDDGGEFDVSGGASAGSGLSSGSGVGKSAAGDDEESGGFNS